MRCLIWNWLAHKTYRGRYSDGEVAVGKGTRKSRYAHHWSFNLTHNQWDRKRLLACERRPFREQAQPQHEAAWLRRTAARPKTLAKSLLRDASAFPECATRRAADEAKTILLADHEATAVSKVRMKF
jgi:hypothetical protein